MKIMKIAALQKIKSNLLVEYKLELNITNFNFNYLLSLEIRKINN